MKALILCGGIGSRLWPITLSLPKQLIPIAGRPIFHYILDSLVSADIYNIGIVVNNNEQIFKESLKKYDNSKIKTTFINQEIPKGLADAVMISKEFINNERFIMILGDNFYNINLKDIVSQFSKGKMNCKLILKRVSNPKNYGIAVVMGENIVDVMEKPNQSPSNLAITGIYLFDKNIFTGCSSIKPSWRGEYEITDAIKWLVENKYMVNYEIIEEGWKDLGCPEAIVEANQNAMYKISNSIIGTIDNDSKLSGRIILGKNSEVIGSIIRGPAIIGDNSIISNSYIGPFTVIANGVKIINSSIENSIVLDDCNISYSESVIDSSIIDKCSQIEKNISLKKSSSFLLARNSKVILE